MCSPCKIYEIELRLFKSRTSYLAACSLWKLVHELNDTWVLVRSRMLLDIVLNFLLQLVCADSSLCENDRCLYDLSSYRVRCSTYAAFQNIRKVGMTLIKQNFAHNLQIFSEFEQTV